jgi:hypothetical protein
MRVVVSGTHASGKSTLIADFRAVHPGFAHLPDPFELLDDVRAGTDTSSFLAQLAVSARRLEDADPLDDVIGERCPLDFLAYLTAGETLGRDRLPREVLDRAVTLTRDAMQHVDVLVLLPLSSADRIWVHPEEDLELRAAMDDALLELADDPDLTGAHTRIVEITGDREARVRALETAVGRSRG